MLNSANGDEPVEGATVTIGGVTVTTRTRDNADANNNVGTFVIVNPQTGVSTATITPPGGSPQTVAFEPPIGPGDNGQVELFINIGQVRGRVLLPNGQPATNAFVTVAATGETRAVNTNGTFLLELIPVGDTQVFAVQGTASATRTVTVAAGVNEVGDIALVDDPNPTPPGVPNTIIGKVTVPGVGAIAGTNIILFRDGVQIEATQTNATGDYGFYVPPGNYTVRAIRPGFADTDSAPLALTDPNTPIRADLTMASL
ncbi:MAG: hypothetical protein OHK0029_31280 [Armatimonadaceae bacterium]